MCKKKRAEVFLSWQETDILYCTVPIPSAQKKCLFLFLDSIEYLGHTLAQQRKAESGIDLVGPDFQSTSA